jgi:nucleoside-diphosphate-sugar epimerase
MQTILGSGGAIGTELAKALYTYSPDIRLVSRNPQKIQETDQLFPADLTDKAQILKAIEGSSVCYITVGFDYYTKVWQEKWPPFIQHVIDACAATQCKLVFFDNVYAIGGDHVQHITETSPIAPSSKKGAVRAMVDKAIQEAAEKGRIDAIIARAPDFFGPIKDKSLLMLTVYDNLLKGKAAQWFCNADVVHSIGYTPDLAKGTAILGNTASAFNQVWNLPVDTNAINGREWVRLFANELGAKNKLQVLPSWGLWTLGLFIPVLKEMYEMRYQYDRPYFFDASKFIKTFQYTPHTNEAAIKATIEALKSA